MLQRRRARSKVIDGSELNSAMRSKGYLKDGAGNWVKSSSAFRTRLLVEKLQKEKGALTPETVRLRRAIKGAKPRKSSSLEIRFDRLWSSIGGPELTKEHRFHSKRLWRFDRSHLPTKVAIEIHGGVHSGGRHTRGKGFSEDRAKFNTAVAMGWRVFELTPDQLNDTCLRQILALIPAVD